MADRIDERLAALDPTLGDPPPQPGSDRFRLIKEKAMQNVTTPTEGLARTGALPPRQPGRPNPARRRIVQAAAASIVALLAAGLIVSGGEERPAAAEAVRAAAQNLGRVDTLRATLVQTYPDGEVMTFEGEFAGADGRSVGIQTDPSGVEMSRWEHVFIGDSVWFIADLGGVSHERVAPDERLAPFTEAAAAIVAAVLEGGDVEQLGTERVRGLEATHYRIRPDEQSRRALEALAPGQLSWFALEDPWAVETIEVWTADDLVRRVRVTFAEGYFMSTSTSDFYDFGADITIAPPAASDMREPR
jgi:outer membrane lipoprotein-sorting protein